jgi:uncharacterized protein YfaS (alpha-2-macroglobulin family)
MTATPVPSTTDDLLVEIESQATAMTDTAATLVRIIRMQQTTIASLEAALKESRANDLQGMQWLSEVAEAAGLRDVDVPTLIDHVRALRAGTI